MDDLISRQDVIRWVKTECNPYGKPTLEFESGKRVIEHLENMPSAEPQIVRCKDCKHWIPYDWMFSEMWQSKNIADYPEDDIGCDCCDMAMKANDFCSRAERRTE